MSKVCSDDTVKFLDEASLLLHRYNFALLSERDDLVKRAYKIVSELSLDIVMLNIADKESD